MSSAQAELAALWAPELQVSEFADLQAQEQALTELERALDLAGPRLAALEQSVSGDLSFDATIEAQALPEAERVLLQELGVLADAGEISFAAHPEQQRLRQALQQLLSLLEPLSRQLGQYAWVESIEDGQVLARSVVAWNGALTQFWSSPPSLSQHALHRRAVELALRSRGAALRLLGLATQLAFRLTLAFGTPLGPLLAVPAVWHFVLRLRAEAQSK